MAVQDFAQVRHLWDQDACATFPGAIDKSEEYGVDAVLVDNDASGLISTVIGSRRRPDVQQRIALRDVQQDLQRLIGSVPATAKPYFERLLA
jgi:hypothetical protein